MWNKTKTPKYVSTNQRGRGSKEVEGGPIKNIFTPKLFFKIRENLTPYFEL